VPVAAGSAAVPPVRAGDLEAGGGLPPGRIALGPGGRLLVGAADRPLELVEVRPEGRRAMSGAEFARGARLGPEEWLGR
jgi:methionyl-tRNA formyltransferase